MIDNKTMAALKSLLKNGGGTGGTSIDVTAQVGQTIVVKEVDANGKPTAWESAEYQPKICGKEIEELLPTTVATFIANSYFLAPCEFEFIVGNAYTIDWNGTQYTCVAVDIDGAGVGNAALLSGTGDTGEPFMVGVQDGMLLAIPLDGSTELTIGVSGEVYKTIDKAYLPNDVLYCNSTGYTVGTFCLDDWCYGELQWTQICNITYYYNDDEVWVDTPITKEQFETLSGIFENQLVYVNWNNHTACVKPYKVFVSENEWFWRIKWHSVYVKTIMEADFSCCTLGIRWDETSGCVQRSFNAIGPDIP